MVQLGEKKEHVIRNKDENVESTWKEVEVETEEQAGRRWADKLKIFEGGEEKKKEESINTNDLPIKHFTKPADKAAFILYSSLGWMRVLWWEFRQKKSSRTVESEGLVL